MRKIHEIRDEVRVGFLGLLVGLGKAAVAGESIGLEPTWFSPLPEVFFAAPTGLTLQEYAPDWVSIGTPSLENGFLPEVDVHAFQVGSSEGSPDFETFSLQPSGTPARPTDQAR